MVARFEEPLLKLGRDNQTWTLLHAGLGFWYAQKPIIGM